MRATLSLSSDHRVIERVIAALEVAANRLEAGDRVDPQFFLDAARFIAGFADGLHHRKEEGVLFEAMAANGMPTDGGPIAVMLYEHDQGRDFTLGMREAAERLAAGDESARRLVVDNARGYATLLRQHIFKEDNILFPMAGRVIPAAQQDAVFAAFERIERESGASGATEYLALAERLEAAMTPVANT
jgi:hemerythrin-like domain-containing protein